MNKAPVDPRPMPPGAAVPGPGGEDADPYGIKPDYGSIRNIYLRMTVGGAVIVLILQIALYLIFKFHWLPIEFKTSEFIHLLKYLIIPSGINFASTAYAFYFVKHRKVNEFLINAAAVKAMAVVCAVTASAHQVYSITLMLPCLPVVMASIFGNPRLVRYASGFGILGLISAVICRILSPYRHDTVDTKLVPEAVGALAFLLISTMVSLTMLRLLDTQKSRLIHAVQEGQKARHEAQVANQAKSEFLANMSHEIRTPLNAVVGLTEMILRKSEEPEVLEYAGDIQQAGNWLLAIINDILDISKIESGRLEIQEGRYELGSLINDSYNMVAIRCREKGLTMEVTCDPTLPRTLYGDEYHLRQIVVNVLSNAVKYTNVGGVEFHVSGEENGDILRMEILIKDTGIGIKPEDIPHLYEKFSRMDMTKNRTVEGTGLGLSITKQLVDLMKGTIEVESVYGLGTAFTIRIPQKIADRTPIGDIHMTYLNVHDAVEKYHQSFEAPGARILAVDDVAINLQVIRRLLESTRMEIDIATSGGECLTKVREKRYDLILMDHMMPEMDGVQTLKFMEELPDSLNKGVPVIMLTANAMMGAREEYLKQGFVDYLTKPVRGPLLEDAILKYLPAEKVVRFQEEAAPEAAVPTEGLLAKVERLLPEADTASGLSYCADDEAFYRTMLLEFAGSGRDAELEKAFAAEDWPAYQIAVHSMKSAARMVGLSALSDQCFELVSAAREKNADRIRAGHPAVVEHYRQVVQALKGLEE